MKFRFPLQKVLEHRKTLEDIAQRDFREAQSEHLKQQELLQKMYDDLHESRLEAGRVQEGHATNAPERLKQIFEFGKFQEIRIQRQKAKVGEAEKLVEEMREILRQKAIDLKMIEKLKERRREEFLRERNARELKENDETAVLRFKAKDGG